MNLLSKLISPLAAVITVVVTLALSHFLTDWTNMPGYGLWTGIRPIEDKLIKLETFAKEGPVDAIVLGSSIGDFGFSAELYSKLMSEKLGHPYRVFNFSSGAVELVTTPSMYRIARTVTKPKAIFLISPAEIKRGEVLSPYSPDYILNHSPIGSAIHNQYLLGLQKTLWFFLPIVDKSAALRDLIIFGNFHNLVGQGMDTYQVNAYGDRLSYTAGALDVAQMNLFRQSAETSVKLIKKGSEQDLATAQNTFFPVIDIKAMAEIRKIALDDGLKIFVLAHSPAATLWKDPTSSSDYKKARTQYVDTLTKSVGGILLNPLDGLSIPDYAVMEYTHLNTHGAQIYTSAVFQSAIASGSSNQYRQNEVEQASLEPIRSKEATFSTWSAVVLREKGKRYKYLKCRFVQSIAVPPLPQTDLYFALRMPDGSDIISPARQLKSGEYEADVDLGKSDKEQALIFRLLYGSDTKVTVNAPLASYAWTSVP